LLDKLKANFEKNILKFGLYSIRNIFRDDLPNDNHNSNNNNNSMIMEPKTTSISSELPTPPTTLLSTTTATSNDPPSTATTATPTTTTNIKTNHSQLITPAHPLFITSNLDTIKLDENLQHYHHQYTELYTDYTRIVSECQDMDALIKDMRETSFSIRLRIQDVDQQFESQSLADTTNAVEVYRQRLHSQARLAQQLIRKIEEHLYPSSMIGGSNSNNSTSDETNNNNNNNLISTGRYLSSTSPPLPTAITEEDLYRKKEEEEMYFKDGKNILPFVVILFLCDI
jgi:hypothetical protein